MIQDDPELGEFRFVILGGFCSVHAFGICSVRTTSETNSSGSSNHLPHGRKIKGRGCGGQVAASATGQGSARWSIKDDLW